MSNTQSTGDLARMEVLPAAGLDPVTHGEIDIAIATAKRFPRSIEKFRKDARGMATIDEDTASSCWYAVPRAGKKIEGPSVRLAEIVSVCYGNLRVVRRVISEDDRFVTCAAYAWDLERNLLQASEVRRRITNKDGGRYTDDMIANTINAGLSIAGRNAVFATVPRSFINDIYEDCKKASRGTIATLSVRRQKALDWFEAEKIPAARVFAGLGVRGVDDIGLEHLELLQGVRTAIREGEIKASEAFMDANGAAPVQQDPVSRLMTDLGCSELLAKGILAAWDTLKVSEAKRTVMAKKYAGKVADLLEALDMMGCPVAETTAAVPNQGQSPTASYAKGAAEDDLIGPNTPTTAPDNLESAAERADRLKQDAELAQAEAAPVEKPAAKTTAPKASKPTGRFGF